MLRTLLFICCFAGSLINAAQANMPFPFFFVRGDRIVTLAPGNKRLLCVGVNGTKLWDRALGTHASLREAPGEQLMVKIGADLSAISVETGDLTPLFSMTTAYETIHSFEPGGFIYTKRNVTNARTITVLQMPSGKPLFTIDDAVDVAALTAKVLVVKIVEKEPVRRARFEGVDRQTGKKLWRVPLDTSFPVETEFRAPHLAYASAKRRIALIDCDTGRELGRRDIGSPQSAAPDVQFQGANVVALHCAPGVTTRDSSKVTLDYLTFPDLRVVGSKGLQCVTASRFEFANDFVVCEVPETTTGSTGGATRTIPASVAGLRLTGQELWRRYSWDQYKVRGDVVFYSAHNATSAWLGALDIASGNEKILYVEAPDQKAEPAVQ
jgi:hypothetical protein